MPSLDVFFAALGPIEWVGQSITSSPKEGGDNGLTRLGDLLTDVQIQKLRPFIWPAQVILIVIGIASLSVALIRA